MKKRYPATTIILIALIALRFFGQAMSAFWADGWMNVIIYLIVGCVYLAAFIGVMQKAMWGVIVVSIVAGIDLVGSIYIGGATGFGSAFLDVLLLVLAYLEYRNLKQGSAKTPKRR